MHVERFLRLIVEVFILLPLALSRIHTECSSLLHLWEPLPALLYELVPDDVAA